MGWHSTGVTFELHPGRKDLFLSVAEIRHLVLLDSNTENEKIRKKNMTSKESVVEEEKNS